MNIYYDPEKFGLEIVVDIDTGCGYEFDMFVVWHEKATGRLGFATDAGCSCPTPFEYMGVDDIQWASRHEIAAKVQEYANEQNQYYKNVSELEVANLIDKVVNHR